MADAVAPQSVPSRSPEPTSSMATCSSSFETMRSMRVIFLPQESDGLKRNQFGGTVGGPIRKDKGFLFRRLPGSTVRQTPSDSTVFVPTAEMLAGDFTTFVSPACNNGRQIHLNGAFVNNRIDPTLFSPAALKIAAYCRSRWILAADTSPEMFCTKTIFSSRFEGRLSVERYAELFCALHADQHRRYNPYDLNNQILNSTYTAGPRRRIR